MYRITVVIEGNGTGNLAAGLAEVQRKVEQGFTSGADGEPDGNYRFSVDVIDPREGQRDERLIADCLGDITEALEEAVAHGDLGAIANGVAELGRLRQALAGWQGGLSEADVLRAKGSLEELATGAQMKNDAERAMTDASARIKFFRRRACYSEVWWHDQILVKGADGESSITFAEGDCTDSQLIDVDELQEVALDDLDDDEVVAVAINEFAESAEQQEQLKQMNLDEIREWLKRKLQGEEEQ